MGERYVRPPLVGTEPPRPWVAVWRFRAVVAVLTAGLLLVGFLLYQHLSGATAQDPGVEPPRPVPQSHPR